MKLRKLYGSAAIIGHSQAPSKPQTPKSMFNKIIATVAALAAAAGSAMAQGAPGFDEATTIVAGADTLVTSILPITATVVGVGVALSLVKLVRRK